MRKIVAGLIGVVFIVTIGVFAIPEPDPFPAVPLPELGDGPITLRVVRAINPRFDALTEAEFEEVLRQTVDLVQFHFGLEVQFERGEDYDVSELMKLNPPAAREDAIGLTYELPDPSRAPMRLAGMIARALENGQSSIAEAVEVLGPLIPGAAEMDVDDLALAIAEVWANGLRRWQGLRAQDRRPVIDFGINHQKAIWDVLGYGDLPFEIVMTNQLIASAELYGFYPGLAKLGGLSLGSTAFSRSSSLGTFGMVSTFFLVNDLGNLSNLGPNQIIHDPSVIRENALTLTHEIGHMLMHLGHPEGKPGCIMSAAYLDVQSAPEVPCPVNSEPAMIPGAGPFTIDRKLLESVTK